MNDLGVAVAMSRASSSASIISLSEGARTPALHAEHGLEGGATKGPAEGLEGPLRPFSDRSGRSHLTARMI
jgi:hypothetical protein